jgi:RNA polymerase sigma-70 factor (ECF subfamily)
MISFRAKAYRLLGSVSEAEDIVQEAFTRLLRADLDAIEDASGWLVVVVARLCLDQLRSARVRREAYLGPWLPEPVVQVDDTHDPADLITLDESVRMAVLILLEQLSPAERVAFVLHDVFEYSFEEVGSMVGRTPAASRQLASRARRRIHEDGSQQKFSVDADEQRRVAERFVEAASGGKLEPLIEVLDPAVVGWVDLGGQVSVGITSGQRLVAERILQFFGPDGRSVLRVVGVNGEPGVAAMRAGRVYAILALEVKNARIAAIHTIRDAGKLAYARSVLEAPSII